MKFAAKSATALALLLVLSACGGEPAEDAATPARTDAAVVPTETAAPAETATPAPTDTATPTAAPTPTASPTPTSTASAAPAAVAEPAAFAQCKACHSVEPGDHGIGPSLAGIWGNKAGSAAGFEASEAMKNSGLTWNQANLSRFLADPAGTVPGNKMPFAGVKDAAQRQAIINYIRAL